MKFSQYMKHSLLTAVTSTMIITSAFTPVEAQETQPGFIPVNTTSPTSSKTSSQSATNSASRLTTSSRTSSSSVPKRPSVAEEPIVAYGAIPEDQQFDTLESNDGIIITGLGSVEINNGDLVIPAQIDGKQVVEIDDKAFQNKGIERIIFEDGVSLLKIGNNAFQGNKITGDLTIDVETIGDNAFAQNEIQSLRLQGTQQVGNDAFRDNKIQSIEFSPNGDTPVNIGDRAFINNRLADEIDLSVVSDIGDEAFSTNKIRTVQVGDDTVLRDKVFANNGAWVEVKTSSGSDSSRGIETKSYDDKTGQVVDPVSIIVRYLDQDGNSIAPEQRIGDDLVNDTQAFEKGKEATFTPRKIQNYRLDTPEIVFTPDSDGYVIEAKYTYVDQRPTITINRDGIELANGEIPSREKLMQGVTAKDKDGNDITSNVKIDTSNVNIDAPGVYDVIYTVVDKNGNERIEKSSVTVGINWGEYEFGGGWQVKDFRFNGDTLLGFSDSGEAKLKAGNTELWIPPVNMSGKEVKKIRGGYWNNGSFSNKGITAIKDWGSITSIGSYTFQSNQISTLPDDWGGITSIGSYAFSNNSLSHLPDDWGNIVIIEGYAFSNNKIAKLPDSWKLVKTIYDGSFYNNKIERLPNTWGEIEALSVSSGFRSSDGAFEKNNISDIPENWGNIKSIGEFTFANNNITSIPNSWNEVVEIKIGAFYSNNIHQLPKSWGKISHIGNGSEGGRGGVGSFENNQLTSLPESWGGDITSIGIGTFKNNQISTLPDDWGSITSIGNGVFNRNQITTLPDDWGSITSIGNGAFYRNQISTLPDDWGSITSIGDWSLADNQISTLPDDWGRITSIGQHAFRYNQITTLPDDWGSITSIVFSAFANNQITTLPDDWGSITSIGDWSFAENQISTLPDDWGKIRSIGDDAFYNNQISTLPDDWGRITSIGQHAFQSNQISTLPDTWGNITSIGNDAFRYNYSLPRNMVFTMKPENLTQRFIDKINKSSIPKPFTIITTDRSNPNNVKSTDDILINPVRVTYRYLDEDGKEIGKSITEIYSSGEQISKTPPFIPGYNVPGEKSFTVARKDTQIVDFIYKKSTIKEDTTTNISLSLNNKNEYLIGSTMTGKIHVDRTGSATEKLTKPRIYVSLDPNVYDLSKLDIDFRTHNIKQDSLRVEGGLVSFELDSLSPADSKDIAFSVPFKKYTTAAHTEYPIEPFIVNQNGQIVRTGDADGFSGHYTMPYENIRSKNVDRYANHLGVVSQYDQTRIDVPNDFPITFVSDDKEGKTVRNTLTYIISNSSLERNIGNYTIRVPLPLYEVHEKSSLYSNDEPRRLAKFDSEKNPGWKLSEDGTYVEYVGTNKNTANSFSQQLVLGYPGAKENSIMNIQATTIMTPTDKPNSEPVIITNDETHTYFSKYQTPPKGEIFAKYPTGNHWTGSINYFYDNSIERNGVFPWIIPYNAPQTMKKVVFRDTDLDSRMYYDTIEIPTNLGDVRIRILDSRGADLQSTTLNKDAKSRKVTFDKNKVMNASELRVELLGDFVKGSNGVIYLTSRLKNPDPKIFDSQNANPEFANTIRFITEDKELGAVKAHKQVQAAKQEIAAFKELVGYNDRVGVKTSLITGDKLTYTVGFTPHAGFGETITNIQEVDLLPKNVDVVNVEMSRSFSQLPGAKYDIQENYKGTGQTAVIFTASSALPEQVNPGSKFTVGTITVQTTMLTADKRIDNDVYVKANNTALANTAKPPFEPTVNWSKANVWTSYEASAGMEARKQIRSYGENNKPNLWTGSVTTFPGEKIDYKLRVTNGTDAVRNNLVVYDVLPHVGDIGIPSVRGSQFENTWDTTRKPTLPAGYKIEYYNGADWPKYNGDDHTDVDKVLSQLAWSTTPSAKTKAIRITAKPGVAMNARSSVEFILPMKANQQNVDAYNNPPADMLNKSAWNSFFWKDNIQKLPIEGNKVENKLKDRPISIAFKKIAAGKNTPLKDAQFELRDASNNIVSTAISDAQGRVFFDNVRVKEGFTIKEIKAPRGYQVSSKVLRITSDHIAQGYAKSPAVINLGNFDNEELPPPPVYGEVEFTKVDADGKPLPGTVFILSNSDNTYEATSNKDGKVIFANVVPATDYKLEETKPVGRLQPINAINKIKVEGDKTTYLGTTVRDVEHAVVNDKVKILLTKLGVNDDRIYNQNGTPKPFGTYQGTDGSKLNGATFQVIDDATGNIVSTINSSSSSDRYIENLTPGKVYRLNETKVPNNYEKVDGLDLRFKVDARGTILHPDGTPMEIQNGIYVPNRNKTQESTVTVLKVDQDKNPVANAVFALQRKENDKWVQVGDTKTSGEDGVVSWNTNNSARYRIVETQAPNGYIGKYVSQEFLMQRTQSKTFSYTAVNDRIRPEVAKVEFIAQNLPTREAAMEIRDQNKNSVIEQRNNNWNVVRYLEGAVIEVRENDAQGALIQTITTDSTGKAQITADIDPDKNYVLVETQAPEGYELRTQPLTFNATTRLATDPSAKDGKFTVFVPNYKKNGRIVVSKLNESTGNPITGISATFEALRVNPVDGQPQDDDIEIDGVFYRPTGRTITQKTSQSAGVASFNNLDYGTYIVRETASPDGYVLDATPALFTVDENNASHTFVFNNTPENPEVDITKYINGHDANNDITAVWLENNADTMNVKTVVENTGNTKLEKVTITDAIRDTDDQYINEAIKTAMFTIRDADGNLIAENVANGEITLNPGDIVETTVNVASPEKGEMHRDDATVVGYYGDIEVTDEDPAHAYRIPDVVDFILPSTGAVPRFGILFLIVMTMLGVAFGIMRRKNIA